MSYHLSREGRQLGVFSLEDIRAKLLTGELRAGDHGWTAGMAGWKTLAEIAPATTPPPAPEPVPVAAPAPAAEPASERTESEQSQNPVDPITSASAAKRHGRPRRRSKPQNHLVGAILVTLFCCLPLGIPAIIYASQVDGKYKVGDQFGAHESAHKAKLWIRASAVVGLLGALVYVALSFAGVTMAG